LLASSCVDKGIDVFFCFLQNGRGCLGCLLWCAIHSMHRPCLLQDFHLQGQSTTSTEDLSIMINPLSNTSFLTIFKQYTLCLLALQMINVIYKAFIGVAAKTIISFICSLVKMYKLFFPSNNRT
jgi:hypothetical protein